MQDYSQAFAFINALTGNQAETAIIDWRAIHDTDKATAAIPFRDTLANAWSSIVHYNNQGYGIFATIAEMDGIGRELSNVQAIRAHYVDLDNLVTAPMSFDRAQKWYPAPSFAVQSSAGKYHVYWPVGAYRDNDRFQVVQRKLRQFFDGDKAVIDATRVMRVPGTLHLKNPSQPHLVTCFALPGFGTVNPVEYLEAALSSVNVIEGGGGRHELGDPALAAPSLDWIRYALTLIDPNDLDRGEWISLTAAIKQAGWSLVTQEEQLFELWSQWCARYAHNDLGENWKQWQSIRQTEVGWNSIVRRAPGLRAHLAFGGVEHAMPAGATAVAASGGAGVPSMPEPPALDCSGEYLTHLEQEQWFAGCLYVGNRGEILTPKGRFVGPGAFNAEYGGKKFIIDSEGKTTDEPWKAATRSTLRTIPKVDHVRFSPQHKFGEIIVDQLGRKGVNTYIPIKIRAIPGDVTPWLQHMAFMLPNEADRQSFFAYLAHCVKYPGFKIPWAPMLQSTEGTGKTVIIDIMNAVLGEMYCYNPKAEQLISSGSTFNAWMRDKLMIIVNEIKIDERRELIEILKPMITDARIEVQAKGIDQAMEDNVANWIFFSNWKDAIPINKSSRRYAIYYSAIQSERDLFLRGMDGAYFTKLFAWVRGDGSAHVAHWLLNYPIERGAIPMRAPDTSSKLEAERLSRGPLEQIIIDALEDGLQGFRGGWVSVEAALKLIKARGGKPPSPRTIGAICESLGFVMVGRSPAPIWHEDSQARSTLYNINPLASVETYTASQGYPDK